MLSTLSIILGLIILVIAADILVNGSSALAKRLGISDLIIGLTIVAAGTSMPEFFTSFIAAVKGASDIAIGNILGSNIGNILLILGLSAVVYPVIAQKTTMRYEIPTSLFLAGLLYVIAYGLSFSQEGVVSRLGGVVLLATFIGFVCYTLWLGKSQSIEKIEVNAHQSWWIISLKIIGGIAGLGAGAYFLVAGATDIARTLGVSEALIGLTIVAIGTSLPELFTSVVAAYKKNSDIAIGNIVGSNIFNISFILGATALISPIKVSSSFQSDFTILGLTTLLLMGLLWIGGGKLGRFGGVICIVGYLAYTTLLVVTKG